MKYNLIKNGLRQEKLRQIDNYICTQYSCCWNAAICSSFLGDQNGHFRMKFGYFHLVTMNSKKESLSKLER